ncbi:TBC1 domain family member protein [Quillaja saponaria]|uniref:TBC1 domain family member protein n=1 Tax=Quillaja saponaria TaxID=32244 RepID=A0AAD7PH23_QUISA|nr:TBC1 domain family member protein [Quillaja saponaria]
MVKKRVPDWLNSSMWSSSSSDDHTSHLPNTTTTTTTTITNTTTTATMTNSNSIPPTIEPSMDLPVPVPPPSATREGPPKPQIIEDSRIKNSNNDYNDNSSSPSADDISRQAQLLSELSRKVIDLRELRKNVCQGIPDGAGIRSTVWKLLLGYLPPDRGLWSSELAKKRSQYKHFKEDLLMNPSDITRKLYTSTSYGNDEPKCESRALLSRSEITQGEHPLSLGKTSIWNQFFQDTEIIEQIDRDVMRTHPDMHFFSGDSQSAKSNQEALKNILIVFAKLNPGIRYVQGMNEILAPLFYVFKNDPDAENAVSAEADAFFCFVELLSGFRDHFCQQLDNSVVGIRATITRLSQLLKGHDEELWRHLEITTKVNPQFYAFRWITLLLTQEFNFADSLHIWDTLLSDPEGPQEILLRICCAMLILVRRRLLAGDFTSNLKLLQNYPSTNISHLLYVANKLRVQPST